MAKWYEQDGAVLNAVAIEAVAKPWRERRTTTFDQTVRYFDFESYGKTFTQVAIVLTPSEPLIVDGRRVVLVCSEGGSDNGRGFIKNTALEEGIGPWLARRGVTFIALCRLGRWNFLTEDPLGSWLDVPLGGRMPMFNRHQRTHWSPDDYIETGAKTFVDTNVSESIGGRVPRPGTELEAYSMALAPVTSIRGFEIGVNECLGMNRSDALLLYWGFSTGGTYVWALAKRLTPDGMLGYATANFPVTYYGAWSVDGDHSWLYDPSTFRVRERGMADFTFFNKELPEAQREELWREALHAPRFKSHEDTFMTFAVAALAEGLTRLWRAPFLPQSVRDRGYSRLLQDNLDLAFPDASLNGIDVLDLYGTKDEVMPPAIAREVGQIMRFYCHRYIQASLDGYHHSITADHVEAFASLWLDAIQGGYFRPALAPKAVLSA